MNDPKIIVALDYPDAATANRLVAQLDPTLCRLKVGKELFTAEGPALVSTLVEKGYGVFLDLKFHDIPNTVAKACSAASRLGIWMLNVHAMGGRAMMEAAREAANQASMPPQAHCSHRADQHGSARPARNRRRRGAAGPGIATGPAGKSMQA